MTTDGVTVRALVLDAIDRHMRLESFAMRPPRTGEVQVALRASGVCHSDLRTRLGDWGSELPIVLGHEGAGVVEALGEGVGGISVGDHVVLAWVASCGRCRRCASGQAWACPAGNDVPFHEPSAPLRRGDQGVAQFLGLGTFAERVVVPQTAVVPIPRDVPFDVAALIGCAVSTGTGAVFHNARLRPGDSAVVLGCGGVGLSAVMGARVAGAHTIIAVDVNPEKLDLAGELGATHRVLGSTPAETVAGVRHIAPDGVDHAFETVGHPSTMRTAIDLLGMAGSAVLVGMPAEGTTLTIDPLELAARGQRIIGSNSGGTSPAADFATLCKLYLAGRLPVDRLISHRIGLDEVEQAFDEMADGRRARSVVVFDGA